MCEGVERLARVLAKESAHEHAYGEHWMGWPDPENDQEMAESVEQEMPRARRLAERYAAILGHRASPIDVMGDHDSE